MISSVPSPTAEGAEYDAVPLVEPVTSPYLAVQAISAASGNSASWTSDPSKIESLISVVDPVVAVKFSGSIAMRLIQGSIAGTFSSRPDSGVTGTTALSSTKFAVAEIVWLESSQPLPTRCMAVKLSYSPSNVETSHVTLEPTDRHPVGIVPKDVPASKAMLMPGSGSSRRRSTRTVQDAIPVSVLKEAFERVMLGQISSRNLRSLLGFDAGICWPSIVALTVSRTRLLKQM